jgi:hypothetical protein
MSTRSLINPSCSCVTQTSKAMSRPPPRFTTIAHVLANVARAGFKTCLQGFQAGRRRMVVLYNRLSTMTMQAA